jgi:hypothetical protein
MIDKNHVELLTATGPLHQNHKKLDLIYFFHFLRESFAEILLNSDENIITVTLQRGSFKFHIWDILSKEVINVIECPFSQSLYGISVSS